MQGRRHDLNRDYPASAGMRRHTMLTHATHHPLYHRTIVLEKRNRALAETGGQRCTLISYRQLPSGILEPPYRPMESDGRVRPSPLMLSTESPALPLLIKHSFLNPWTCSSQLASIRTEGIIMISAAYATEGPVQGQGNDSVST